MKEHMLAIILFSAAMSGFSAEPGARCLSADLKLNSQLLPTCQYELELRRAGGPRPDVVQRLLIERVDSDSLWGKLVIDACMEGLVSCSEFSPLALARAEREKRYPEAARSTTRRIAEEATLQGMTPGRRRAFYLDAIRRGSAENAGVRLDSANAALRIFSERMYDLIDEITKAQAEGLLSKTERLEREIAIARALTSPDPKRSLLDLTREGISQPTDSPSELLAKAALGELRRLNLGGTVDDLKDVVRLFEPAKEEHARRKKELLEKVSQKRHLSASERSLLAENAYLGVLGVKAVELIGDLGDRDFERRILGDRVLWDQVNEAEKILVGQGKLHRSDMVSR